MTEYLQTPRTVQEDNPTYKTNIAQAEYAANFPGKCEMDYHVKIYSGRGPYYMDGIWRGGRGLTEEGTYRVHLASLQTPGRYGSSYFPPNSYYINTQNFKNVINHSFREWTYPMFDINQQRGYWKQNQIMKSALPYTIKKDDGVSQALYELVELCRKID